MKTSSNGPAADSPATLRHDLRNRVNQILGYSEMLIEEASETAEAHPFAPDLERIRAAGHGLLTLIDDAFPSDSGSHEAPVVSSPPAPIPATTPPARLEFSSGDSEDVGNLLIVDDIADNREILTRRLERQGHRCTSAAGGAEALELLTRNRFDVILLDLMMPGIDGFAVLSHIKADPNLHTTPVIMISANEDLDSVVRCIERGAADYLSKPFNPVLLRARVSACLREKRLRDREERLFHELEANYERERRIADALQSSLIEDIPENLFPDLAVAALYEAAWSEAQVGGDLFDAFPLPSGRVVLAVADASGKGLAAAARISQAKYVLRAFAREYEDRPEQIVGHLNDFLCNANPLYESAALSFVALSLAIVDPLSGESQIVCAGCEPPLIVRAEAGITDSVGAHGLPLGIEVSAEYTTVLERLGPGDTLVMCTDGITEARRGGEMLGYEGMAQIALDASRGEDGCDLKTIGTTILEGARAFGRGTLRDDACLLLARRR